MDKKSLKGIIKKIEGDRVSQPELEIDISMNKLGQMQIIGTYNSSQNILRPIYKIELTRTFMESLAADFLKFSNNIAKFCLCDQKEKRH